MWFWPRKKTKIAIPKASSELEAAVSEVRGKLAEAVVRNDRTNFRVLQHVQTTPIKDTLEEMFKRLDKVDRRG